MLVQVPSCLVQHTHTLGVRICHQNTDNTCTIEPLFVILAKYWISLGDRGGCAANRMVAGSIPDGVFGIFH
jgi:hypothetical protein